MRNLRALLPDGFIEVGVWHPHPCGGYYEIERWCVGHGLRCYALGEPFTRTGGL